MYLLADVGVGVGVGVGVDDAAGVHDDGDVVVI